MGRSVAIRISIVAVMFTVAAAACSRRPALQQLGEARQVAAALLLAFAEAESAGDRAIMAGTDQAAREFVREAETATARAERSAGTLGPLLQGLDLAQEQAALKAFTTAFAQYQALDRTLLGLAIENTNRKAEQLSFGPAQAAAADLRAALDPIVDTKAGTDAEARALAWHAVAAVRQVQALQAPHIAAAEDGEMTQIEKQMTAALAEARTALDALANTSPAAQGPALERARHALDHFAQLDTELIALSRRNTNVRSQALALGEKRKLGSECEKALHALQDELSKRAQIGTR